MKPNYKEDLFNRIHKLFNEISTTHKDISMAFHRRGDTQIKKVLNRANVALQLVYHGPAEIYFEEILEEQLEIMEELFNEAQRWVDNPMGMTYE